MDMVRIPEAELQKGFRALAPIECAGNRLRSRLMTAVTSWSCCRPRNMRA